MWGPLIYPTVDAMLEITSIAEATYRYVHGEILDAKLYHAVLDSIMGKCEEMMQSRGASQHEQNHVYRQLANERFHGKTAIETFVSIEIAITIANEKNPGVGFRKYMQRCFLGILALQQVVGPWIDVSNELAHKYGNSDTNANIASSCVWFNSTFYTKTVAPSGEFLFYVTPPRKFVVKRPILPIAGSILFDYIKLLFPHTPTIPAFDRTWMEYKLNTTQKRMDAVRDRSSGYRYGNFGTFSESLMGFKEFLYTEEHVNVYESITTIMHLGTNKTTLSETERMEIHEEDAVLLPFVTEYMNHELRLSTFRL